MGESKPDAWMPLYIGDWDSGTRHLDCEQDGAYGRLVRHYWRNGPLPDDDAQLARIVGMSQNKWRKLREVLASFFVVDCGKWTHRRVDAELAKWSERRKKAIERAASGGRAKAASSRNKQDLSSPQAVLKSCSSSSPSVAEPIEGSAHRGRRSSERAPDGRSLIAWRGPDDLRAALVLEMGEAWVMAYLDPSVWQDIPSKGVIPLTGVAAKKLNEAAPIFASFGADIVLAEFAANARRR